MTQKYSGILDTGSMEIETLLRLVVGQYVYLPQASDGNSTAQGNEWIGVMENEGYCDGLDDPNIISDLTEGVS